MASRLYVGNLSYSTTDDGLRDFFAAAGNVKSAEVVIERSSGRSKGFGFVEMETDEGANNAMNQLNGQMLDQRPIRIDFAKPKEDRPRSFGGGGSGVVVDMAVAAVAAVVVVGAMATTVAGSPTRRLLVARRTRESNRRYPKQDSLRDLRQNLQINLAPGHVYFR